MGTDRSWLRWQEGRQSTGYEKMLLATAMLPLPFDLYLLRYRSGAAIPPHTDPVAGMWHFRANLAFGSYEGRRFVCGHCLMRIGPLAVFRPDLEVHSVTRVTRGTRWVLSLGIVRPD